MEHAEDVFEESVYNAQDDTDSMEQLINRKALDWAKDEDILDSLSKEKKAELAFARVPKPKVADSDLEKDVLDLEACLEHLPNKREREVRFIKLQQKVIQLEAQLLSCTYFWSVFKDQFYWQYKIFRKLFMYDITKLLKRYVLYCDEVDLEQELNKFHFWIEKLYSSHVKPNDPEDEKILAPQREVWEKEVWEKRKEKRK